MLVRDECACQGGAHGPGTDGGDRWGTGRDRHDDARDAPRETDANWRMCMIGAGREKVYSK